MRLRHNESCPFTDHVLLCREPLKTRVLDPELDESKTAPPRGYVSPSGDAKAAKSEIVEQNRVCPICHEGITDYNDVVPDHRGPKGWAEPADDHPDTFNNALVCNSEKGSTRMED